MSSAEIIREARERSGLTQAELARRMGVSQPAIAQLESPRSNPRFATLRRALDASGHELELNLRPRSPSIDETTIAAHLRLTPIERVRAHDRASAELARTLASVSHPDR